MTKKQRGVLVLSLFVVASLLLSACEQSLSTPPAETPTPIPTGLFVSPIASVENPMAMIEEFAKQTAAAQTATAGGTPVEAAVTGTPGTPSADLPTATPTLEAGTPTNNVGSSGTTAVTTPATSVPAGSRPASYTLQKGEWPWCIARRYNVDQYAVLQASGLTIAEAESLVSGTVLTIPASAGPFIGERTLKPHPTSYTVISASETIYSIACDFGDVEPNAIASANNISVTATLTAGQQLQIP